MTKQQASSQPSKATMEPFNFQTIFDESTLRNAYSILDIINSYQMKSPDGNTISRDTSQSLRTIVSLYDEIKASKPIRMCLPAFPAKSPNTEDKVLGRLPDMADEFALAHLNGLCKAITDVYEHGAELTIISDGLIYNGMLSNNDPSTAARH